MDESQPLSTFSFKCPLNENEIIKFKDSLVRQQEFIKIVEIQNCPTTSDASKLLSNSVFRSVLESLNNFTILNLKIDEKLNEDHAEKPRIHEFKIKKNFLIAFESIGEKYEGQKIIYWKNMGNFKTITLIEGFSSKLSDFVRNFLIEIVNTASPHSDYPELIDLSDSNGFNLLMKAVDSQKTTLVDELLNLPFYINKKSKDGKTAADIAWEKKNFEILLLLLEANSTFPKDFNSNELDVDDASNEIEEFIKISNEMHKAIKGDKSDKVLEIINEKSNLSCFYNSSNVSAATIAIKSNKPEIYKLLTANECIIGPEEDFNQIIQQLYDENSLNETIVNKMKSKITSAHDSASKELQERHLMILLTNSVVCHDNDCSKLRRKCIKEAFNILNEIPLTKVILQLTAMHKNFKIRFDFNRSSVEFMNPSGGDQTTRGLCQNVKLNEFFVYIGAKDLLDENQKFLTIGTLAHELCHFAMDLTFFNNGKPYAIDDEVNEAKFNDIIMKYKAFEDVESIVELVYNYSCNLWPSELIVRVPHMIATHHNDTNRLNELKTTFKELFDYFDDNVNLKIIETRYMLKKLFDTYIDINYNDLTDAYKANIHHSKVNFQGFDVKFNEIVKDNNFQIYQHLSAAQIRDCLIQNKNITVGFAHNPVKLYIERDFIDQNIKIEKIWNDELSEDYWTDEVLNNIKNFNQISLIVDEMKMILLSDLAGAGKTTTFKHFAVKLKEKFPHYWISYIDLKRHLHVYEKIKEKFQILEALQEILSITDELEIQIFENLFNSNRVILLYDGVDEIAPKFKDFFIKFIESVRNSTKNQQWIATRPQHTHELKAKFNQNAYRLLPYLDDKQIELIDNVLKEFKYKNFKAHEISRAIELSMSSGRIEIVSPLIIEMLTILYVKDKKILENFNLFALFDQMIDMKREIIEEKGSVVSSDRDNRKSKLTIWQVHQIYALKLFYKVGFEDNLNNEQNDRDNDINEFRLLKRWKNQKSKWTPEAISRYGFLYVDNWNTEREFPDFVHRTFAEFFVAQFIVEDLYDDDEIEMSEKEIEIRVNLLMVLSKKKNGFDYFPNFILNFILSFVDSHKAQMMHENFYKLIASDKMRECLNFHMYHYYRVDLFKILSIDERFLKEYRFKVDRTIFQESFVKILDFYDNMEYIRDMVDTYEKSLGDDWFHHTGYKLNENFSMPNDEEIDEIVSQNFIHKDNKRRVIDYKRFYKLLFLIDQCVIPQDDILGFFKQYFREILICSFKNSRATEKLMKIIEDSFNDCKEKFLKFLKDEKLSRLEMHLNFYETAGAYRKNVIEFCVNLEIFLHIDNLISSDCVKSAMLNIYTRFCGVKILKSFYENNYLARGEFQEYLIKDLVPIIDCIYDKYNDEEIRNFLNLVKKMFNNPNDKAQVRKLLEKRYEIDFHHYRGHTLLSYVDIIITDSRKYKIYAHNNAIAIKNTILELAKSAKMLEEEIEKLSIKKGN